MMRTGSGKTDLIKTDLIKTDLIKTDLIKTDLIKTDLGKTAIDGDRPGVTGSHGPDGPSAVVLLAWHGRAIMGGAIPPPLW